MFMFGTMEDTEKLQIDFDKSLFSIFTRLYKKKCSNKDVLALFNYARCDDATSENKEASYIIKRLVRGLGSARVHTQSVNFAALVCLLKNSNVSSKELFSSLEKELADADTHSSSEDTELKIIAVLVCGAIIRAGLYKKARKKNINVLKYLIDGSKTKTYLRFLSYLFLSELISHVSQEEFLKTVWPLVKKNLSTAWNEQNLDTLYFLFTAQNTFEAFSLKLQKHMGPVKTALPAICTTILTSQSVLQAEHPVFEEAAKLFSTSKDIVIQFWTVEIEQQLKKISYNKEFRILSLFTYIIKYLNHVNILPQLLTPSFVSVLLQSVSIKKSKQPFETDNSQVGKQVIGSLIQVLEKETVENQTKFEVIKKIILSSGDCNFERKTGTKCIQRMISQCESGGVKKLTTFYVNIVKNSGEKVEGKSWINKERIYFLHGIVKLLNHPAMKDEVNWKVETLMFVFNVGFVRNMNISSEISKTAKESFYNGLNLNLSSVEQLIQVLDKVVSHINKLIENKQIVLEDCAESWSKMLSMLQLIKKKKNKKFNVLSVLLSYMGLQLFKDHSLAKDNIEELISCYKHMEKKQKKISKNEDELEWIEVTVDLLLSLLSRENKLYRHVIACVFPQLTSSINTHCIGQIIDALDPNSESDTLKPEGQSESEEEEEEEEDKDNEEKPDEEESSDDGMSDGDVDEEEEMSVNDKLRMAIRDALGRSGAITDEESEDMDNMDPEEEKRLNEKLGLAFQLLKGSQKENKKKQSRRDAVLMHFRIRILDLVDIYISNEPPMVCCLELLIPLFRILEYSIRDIHQNPLQNRVESVLKKLCNVKKFCNSDNVDKEVLIILLKSILNQEETSGMVYSEMSQNISLICVFLVRCSQQLSSEHSHNSKDKIAKELVKLLKSYFQGREHKISLNLFESVLKLNWDGNWRFLKPLYKLLLDDNIRIFKRNKILELLLLFYHNDRLLTNSSDKQKKTLNHLEEEFMSDFINYLHSNAEKLSEMSKQLTKFLGNLIKLITVAYNSWQKFRKDSTNIPPWKTLLLAFSGLDISFNKSLRGKLLNLSTLFDVKLELSDKPTNNKSRKRKISQSSENGELNEVTQKSKKKRKKSKKEIAQLKQQSQNLRNAASSQGLESFKFSEAKFTEVSDSPLKSKRNKDDESDE